MSAIIVELKDTAVSLDLTIDQAGLGGVSGQAPTVAIRKANDLTSYLDFADFSFKAAGWGTKYAPLTESERGHYSRSLDLTAVSTLAIGDLLIAEFQVDDGGDVKGVAHDLFVIVKSLYDVPSGVWEEPTSVHTTPGTFGDSVQVTLTPAQITMLTEIYRILGLDPTAPLVVSKTARTAGAVVQVIEENVPAAGSVRVSRS